MPSFHQLEGGRSQPLRRGRTKTAEKGALAERRGKKRTGRERECHPCQEGAQNPQRRRAAFFRWTDGADPPVAGADPPVGTTAFQAAPTAPVAELLLGETVYGEESTVVEAGPLVVKRSPDEGEEGSTDEAAAPSGGPRPQRGQRFLAAAQQPRR